MLKQQRILRWERGQKSRAVQDFLAAEEPLEIRVDNQPISVTMRTPGHDDELAAGFLAGEGLISAPEQISKIQTHPRNRNQNVLNVFLAPDVAINFQQLTRHVFMSSSCGLCGKASIESVHRTFPKIKSDLRISGEILLGLGQQLRDAQATFDRTGGLHAAALFDANGKMLVCREDIGRHNAVDKVIGWSFLRGIFPLNAHVLLVSGRASFEIMQKALAAQIPIVAAVSAPSSLAVEFARASKQTLIGFLREQRMNIYSQQKRIVSREEREGGKRKQKS